MKNNKIFRRLTAALLALALVASLAACGGSSGNSGQGGGSSSGGGSAGGSSGSSDAPVLTMPATTVKDGVVRTSQISFDRDELSTDGLSILAVEDGVIYGFNYNFDGDGYAGYELVQFKTDGSGLKKKDLLIGEDDEIVASTFSGGSYYLVIASYSMSQALQYELENEGSTEELAIPDDLSEDASSSYRLCCLSTDAQTVWSVNIEEPKDSGYFYIQAVQVVDDSILLVTSEGVDRYSVKDGSRLETVCSVKSDDFMGVLYTLLDGTVVMMDDSGMSIKVQTYDPASGEFVDRMTLPSVMQGAILYPGRACDFYLAGDDGIYGADLKTASIKPVANYVNSDLDVQGVNALIETQDGRLAIQAYGTDSDLEIWILEPVDPKDVKEKKQITLGGYYIDFEVRSEVINFNKQSNDYRITLMDYSQYDLESDDYENPTGMTRMNTDIVTGNAPDILFMSEAMPVNKYINAGIFEDLTARFESDSEIEKDDFLQNILDAFRTDGKMFVVVPGFYVTGIAGKEKYIGDGSDLTIEKTKEIAKKMKIEESEIFGLSTRDMVFESAIEFSGDQFINEKTSTCDFNNDQFRELLEFVKNFPTEINEERYYDYFTQYLSDQALLGIQYINTVYDYEYMTRQLYGDLNVTVTGFPSSQNKGAAVAAPIQVAISSSASDPDGCWSFVRRFMLPEYQMKMESSLPVSEKALRAQGQVIIDSIKEQREAEKAYLSEMFGDDYTEVEESGLQYVGGDDEDAFKEGDVPDEAADAADGGETADAAQEAATDEAAADDGVYESGDLTGKPVEREDFDGTDEEYQQYLADFESSDANGEETIIAGEDIVQGLDEDGAVSNLPDFNEKDIEEMVRLIKSLTFSVNGESEILNIIREEAEAYFANQKSAAEVSDVIQSRVQVYLKENE